MRQFYRAVPKRNVPPLRPYATLASQVQPRRDITWIHSPAGTLYHSRDSTYVLKVKQVPEFELVAAQEMSMKFERHTSAENVLLSDDWTKSVHLQNDRSIEFHNQGGV